MTTIPVTFTFDAQAVGRMRNDVTVTSVEPASGGVYELATDEGPMHGGQASAPTPLHLFTASLAGCFMTQVRAFAKRMKVTVDGLRVSGTAHWQATAEPGEPYVSEPIGITLAVHVDSTAGSLELIDLLEAAKKGCFIEQSLAAGVQVRHELHHDGRVLDVESSPRAAESGGTP